MRLKLRFSKFTMLCIKELKRLLIMDGYPSTITNGFVLDTAIETVEKNLKIKDINWIHVSTIGEKILFKNFSGDNEIATINSSLTIRQTSSDFICSLTTFLTQEIFIGRVYKQYTVKLIIITALLIKYGKFDSEYYIKS